MSDVLIVGLISAAVTVLSIFISAKATQDKMTNKLDTNQQVMNNEMTHIKSEMTEMKDAIKKSCTRTFQAVRIDVNNEYEVLETFMEKLPEALKPAGRAAILTFHSGEDRIVKQAFRSFYRAGVYSRVAKEVIRPSATECHMNPRAHSTKLRWAVKA